MPDSLCTLVCRNFCREAEAVCAASTLEGIRVGSFPPNCGRPGLTWDDLEAARARPDEPLVVFGGACLADLDDAGARARGLTLRRLQHCHELVVNPRLFEAFTAQGTYVLTPGWLQDWRTHLAAQGGDPDMVKALWRETLARLLLLDTGAGESQAAFQALCSHLELPGETVPLGLDHMQLMIEREILDARLKLQATRAEGSLNLAQRQAADRATAMEFLGALSQSLREEDVVTGIKDLFRMLFHAEVVDFVPCRGAEPVGPALSGRPYLETERGFAVPVGTSMGPVGVMRVEGLAFPQHKPHYLNLSLSMAGVCALAVQNAQTYRAVEESRAYQRLILDILDVFYQPEGSARDLDQVLGFIQAFARVDALALRIQEGGRFVYAHARGYSREFMELDCARCLRGMAGDLQAAPPGAARTSRGSLWANDLGGGAPCPCSASGFAAVALIQLPVDPETQGILQLHFKDQGAFTATLVERLEGATRSIAIGLERRWAEEGLRAINQELESRVRERTGQLAATNRELRQEILERTRAEQHLESQSAELQARLKELHCLYALSNLFEHREESVEDLCQQAVLMIPAGWRSPGRTQARLRLDDKEFTSCSALGPEPSLSAPITIDGRQRGSLDIFVDPEEGATPFLEEERDLIRTIADLIQGLVDRSEVEAEKLKAEQQLLQSQKLEAIGTLAGGIAHDFNNALTPITALAAMSLSKLPSDSPQRKHFELIAKAADRAKGLVDQILLFSRRKAPSLVPIDLGPLLKEIMKLMRATLPSTIEIRHDFLPCGKVMGDPTQIHQIVMNLCTNAYHAMQERGGVLVVRLSRSRIAAGDALCTLGLAAGEYAQLEVADTGLGMSREVQARIFEPFFTTKDPGKGTGMGLSVVHGIVSTYRGHISVYSEPGKGTTFRIFLPIAQDPLEPQAGPVAAPWIPRGSERILVVDDEEDIRWTLSAMLQSLGYSTQSAEGGLEALERFRRDPGAFDLVITDMTMPKLTGLDLALSIHVLSPAARVVLCSGFSDRLEPRNLEAAGVREFIQKPFAMAEVAQAIRRELDRTS